jgi:hypothetical protein
MACGCNSEPPHDGWGLIPELRLAGLDQPRGTSSSRAPAPRRDFSGLYWAAVLVLFILFLKGRG